MDSVDLADEQGREFQGGDLLVAGDEVGHLREPVDHREDCVVGSRLRQPGYEIHRDGLPREGCGRDGLKKTLGLGPPLLVALTRGAGLDIVGH